MTGDLEPTAELITAKLQLQDKFSKAYPSQDLLEDVPLDVLPEEDRAHIMLRSDGNNFYVAFSDDDDNLKPTPEGFLPNAHIKQISVMSGPRRTGAVIKELIDKTREMESRQK